MKLEKLVGLGMKYCDKYIMKGDNKFCPYQMKGCTYQGVRAMFLEKNKIRGYYQCKRK